MSSLPNNCSHCGADTCRDRDAGLTYCSSCGGALRTAPVVAEPDSPTPPDADDVADRTRWKRCFWLAFFLTPVATVAAGAGANFLYHTFPTMNDKLSPLLGIYSVIGTFAGGVLSSSYCLLRIRNEPLTRSETIAHMVFYSFGMIVAYGGVFFAGCGVLSVFIR